jgi:hypothetical protein
MTRAEMKARMTQREWMDWLNWMALYPSGIGERGAYVRAGTVAAMVATVNRDPKVHRDGFTPIDVYPWLAGDGEGVADEPTPEETAARMRAAFAGAGATVIDLREGAG